MKYERDYYLACAREMEKIGGGFASALAQAFYVADESNARKILDAFHTLFEKFDPIGDTK
jgi:hypothetical protein